MRARLHEQVIRLKSEFVEPYFGVTVLPDYAGPRVLRYSAGGHYLPHVDACTLRWVDGNEVWVKTSARDVSILVYLNDASEFSGGQLAFPDLHVSITPQRGMAVAFPSDQRFRHCVEEITSGTRCVVAAWFTCEEGSPVGEPFQVTW